ncbi:probable histone-arginine methyltransferase CARM1 [Prosopis cineraria]|uniref:probable histone-arginine methyltransferase CARM1 n=1 Tax=Prosopis cineraria TaxID=364024 RepID=UPI00240F67CD|nr:probable histone-arginine methyltransferase CARM1 [Prosopis cineraria]
MLYIEQTLMKPALPLSCFFLVLSELHSSTGVNPVAGIVFSRTQPVVDAFDPRLLIAPPMFHVTDFTKIKIIAPLQEELYEIDIPLRFMAAVVARVHGLACWFDVLFNGRWLTTAPGSRTTYQCQLHCVLSQPNYVRAGQEITGRLHMITL